MRYELIDRLRRCRNRHELPPAYAAGYAFVGAGRHARQNLYPIVDYLHLPLRYVCCATPASARAVQAWRPGVRAVCDLGEVLADPAVRGVFVAAPARVQAALARRILESGRALFVEKPPCRDGAELARLLAAERAGGAPLAVAGLQRRCAPDVRLLARRIGRKRAACYQLTYRTGPYPEGDALTELFLHPLDLAVHLFGPARVEGFQCVGRAPRDGQTLHLLLRHGEVCGNMTLSTAGAWNAAEDELRVDTAEGCYTLHPGRGLTLRRWPARLFGLPAEKLRREAGTALRLWEVQPGLPELCQNALYVNGFYEEVRRFAEVVEGRAADHPAALAHLTDTYALLDAVRRRWTGDGNPAAAH